MGNDQFTLGERTTDFSKKVLAFCKKENITALNRSIIDQLIRSATSIGANYAEANNAASKIDFRNKIFIAKKETAETKYWLSLLEGLTVDTNAHAELVKECHQLLMIFQKIVSTIKHGKAKAGFVSSH